MHLASDSAPLAGLLGGVGIGLSAAFTLFSLGRISGMSGIVARATVQGPGQDAAFEVAYVSGLLAAGRLLAAYYPSALGTAAAAASAPGALILSSGALVAAGLLVGTGSLLGGGCTSGHGVCGLGRFSPRSLLAIAIFLPAASLTMSLLRNQAWLYSLVYSVATTAATPTAFSLIPAGAVLLAALAILRANAAQNPKATASGDSRSWRSRLIRGAASFTGALVFGLSLGVAGMTNPERIARFLDFTSAERGFDPTLACVMGGAVATTMLAFSYLAQLRDSPLLAPEAAPLKELLVIGMHPKNMVFDGRLILGSLLFGVGWGIAGICPGPAVVSFGAGASTTSLFVPAMILGFTFHSLFLA